MNDVHEVQENRSSNGSDMNDETGLGEHKSGSETQLRKEQKDVLRSNVWLV